MQALKRRTISRMAVNAAISITWRDLFDLLESLLTISLDLWRPTRSGIFDEICLDICRDDLEAKNVIRSYFPEYVETS